MSDPPEGSAISEPRLEVNPSALSLVIDPVGYPGVAELGRELGATLMLSGVVVPPEVESILHRWLPIASHRMESGGWWPSFEPEPEPWEQPDRFQSPDQHLVP